MEYIWTKQLLLLLLLLLKFTGEEKRHTKKQKSKTVRRHPRNSMYQWPWEAMPQLLDLVPIHTRQHQTDKLYTLCPFDVFH